MPPHAHLLSKHIVARQQSTNLLFKSSLHPRAGDWRLEKLLLGFHEDVLVPCHDLHSLPYLPDERLGGGGHHRHGELCLLPSMVELLIVSRSVDGSASTLLLCHQFVPTCLNTLNGPISKSRQHSTQCVKEVLLMDIAMAELAGMSSQLDIGFLLYCQRSFALFCSSSSSSITQTFMSRMGSFLLWWLNE